MRRDCTAARWNASWVALGCVLVTLVAIPVQGDDTPPPFNPLAPPTGGPRSSPGPSPDDIKAYEGRRAREFEERMRKEQEGRKPEHVIANGVRDLAQARDSLDPERAKRLMSDHRFELSPVVRQDFLADASVLESVEVMLDDAATATLRVIDIGSDTVLGEQQLPSERFGLGIARFDPALPLRPGDFYRIEIARAADPTTRPLRCYLSEGNAIPFAGLTYRDATGAFVASERPLDLAVRVVGRDAVPAVPEPTKRALLVLLDKTGLERQVAKLSHLSVAIYQGRGLSRPVEWVASADETIERILVRKHAALDTECRIATPLSPPWDKYVFYEFDDSPTPPGYIAAQQEQNRRIAELIAQAERPERWKLESRADETLEKAERARLAELTSERIHALADASFDAVVVLEGPGLTAEQVLRTIRELAPTHRVDLHVLTTGDRDAILLSGTGTAGSERLDDATFFLPIRRGVLRGELKLALGGVYSLAEFGAAKWSEWNALGTTSIVASRVGNYLPHQYADFLRIWMRAGARPQIMWVSAHDAENIAIEFARKSSPFAAAHPDLLEP